MMSDDPLWRAKRIMDRFAERTGLTSDGRPRRYLWTDAFAVCNYAGLYEELGDEDSLELAAALVAQVHRVLGRHRADDERSGWISGLSESEGARRPTAGGLRIGKPRRERGPAEPYDPLGEWDRDGQYYHYLTKWMVALNRMWGITEDVAYHRQAVDLARAAHAGFTIRSAAGPRLAWKMSIDLSRPLVPSSGLHDPLDGLITASELVATRPDGTPGTILDAEIGELSSLCRGVSWTTDDLLGVGGLLVDLLRCVDLMDLDHPTGRAHLPSVAADARVSLERLGGSRFLDDPPQRRLAFRELGLALGIRAIRFAEARGLESRPGVGPEMMATFRRYGAAGPRIVEFWSHPENRRVASWVERRDISEVMWATCLAPRGFLEL